VPHILSPIIDESNSGFWAEGSPYTKDNIYSIKSDKLPPVNYDVHHIKAHSLTHAEAPRHTQKEGNCIASFFSDPKYFYGKATVVRLKGNNYKLIDESNNIFHWEVQLDELKRELLQVPQKLLLTTDYYPIESSGNNTIF
jgi:kynurenine formamidase